MARRRYWIAGGVLVVVIAAGIVVGYLATRAPGWLGERASAASGRAVEIGALAVDWAWTPTVRISDLSVGNAEWGETEHLLTARELRFRIRLLPLLVGRIELPELTVDGASLAIERRADGEGNWSFSSSPGAATAAEVVEPEERSEVPTIGRLRITDGKVIIRDAERELRLDGKVNTATGDAEDADSLELAVDGQLAGKPLRASLRGGSILMLRDGDEPYPLDLEIGFGETRLTIGGTFLDPIAFEGARIEMTLRGPNLAEVFPLLGIPAPPTPPYELAGQLQRDGEVWSMTGMSGRIGNSDIAGDVGVDYGRKTPLLTAKLVSRRLDFDDLAPLVGVPPAEGEAASKEQKDEQRRLREQDDLFPDTPIDVARLRAMDMDIALRADDVRARDFLPVDSVDFRVRVQDGRAEANPLRFEVAGGRIEGELAVNGRTAVPSADIDLRFQGLGLAAFFKGTDFYDTMGGELQGRLYLIGSGHSLAELMASADGNGALAMSGGAISGLLVEAAGLDLSEALILVVGDDAKVPIRCALTRIEVKAGRADIRRGVVDTSDSVLYFHGGVDLGAQTMVMDIEADAKDFSLLDIDAPVHLEGKIRDPEISIGKGSPIPFLELGDGEDVPCDRLSEEYLRPPEKQR